MTDLLHAIEDLRARVGGEPALTGWESFDQAAITAYGAMTGEDLWIHSDPDRAATSRFGGTIVQSSLLMARFGSWIQACALWLPDPAVPVNYGYDRVRIPGALPVGESVRGRVALIELTEAPESCRLKIRVDALRRDIERPVISAEWIVMFLLPSKQR